jgi:hypothetical protein
MLPFAAGPLAAADFEGGDDLEDALGIFPSSSSHHPGLLAMLGSSTVRRALRPGMPALTQAWGQRGSQGSGMLVAAG